MTTNAPNATVMTFYRYQHESTLLIPESVVWLPYALLVVAVLVGLALDFFRFHQKNTLKYASMKEHASIVGRSPKRQRICMISGVRLKFKKGKPVLGDVWNTSPSSSDVSNYSPCRERPSHERSYQNSCYSRDVSPSEDGLKAGNATRHRDNSSFKSLANSESDDDEAYKEPAAWTIGGETISTESKRDQPSNDSFGFSVAGSDAETQGQGQGGAKNHKSRQVRTSAEVEKVRHHTDDSPGRWFKDVGTQTEPVEITSIVDVSNKGSKFPASPRSGRRNLPTIPNQSTNQVSSNTLDPNNTQTTSTNKTHTISRTDYTDIYNKDNKLLTPPPNYSTCCDVSGNTGYTSNANTNWQLHPGHQHQQQQQYHQRSSKRDTLNVTDLSPVESTSVIDFSPRSHVSERSRDGASKDATPRTPRIKHDRRRKDIHIDILSSPRSPTTEIVAKDHGFELAGIEVPSYSGVCSSSTGGQSQSGGSSGAQGSKPLGMQTKSFIRPVMSAGATSSPLNSGGFKYRQDSGSGLGEAVEMDASFQRHAYRRGHSLSMEMDEDSSNVPLSVRSMPSGSKSNNKRNSQSPNHIRPPKSDRSGSTSPRPKKDRDRDKEKERDRDGDRDKERTRTKSKRESVDEDRDYPDRTPSVGDKGRDSGRGDKGRVKESSRSNRPPLRTMSIAGSTDHLDQDDTSMYQSSSSVQHPQLRVHNQQQGTPTRSQRDYVDDDRSSNPSRSSQLKQEKEGRSSKQTSSSHSERQENRRQNFSSRSFSSGDHSRDSDTGRTGSGRRKTRDGKERPSSASSRDKSSKSPPHVSSIPTHLFHEDEEGFFSSQASSAAKSSHYGGIGGGGGDQQRKGILFFSRLAGVNRHGGNTSGAGGSGQRKSSGGVYKSGGFES